MPTVPVTFLADAAHGGVGALALLLSVVFALSNYAITAGYLSIPWLVLPHVAMPSDTRTMGIGFFGLCGTTHLGMGTLALLFGYPAIVHVPGMHGIPALILAVLWTVVHVVQAICTIGFVLRFRRDLRVAGARARQFEARLATVPTGEGDGGVR